MRRAILALVAFLPLFAFAQGVTYTEAVTATVAGSSPTDTYSAKVAPIASQLDAVVAELKSDPTKKLVLDRNSLFLNVLTNAAVTLRVTAYTTDTVINALGVYAQKPFYENAPPQSKAAEDQGKHAAWILRTVVPGST